MHAELVYICVSGREKVDSRRNKDWSRGWGENISDGQTSYRRRKKEIRSLD